MILDDELARNGRKLLWCAKVLSYYYAEGAEKSIVSIRQGS
jgi:hypothetical protein